MRAVRLFEAVAGMLASVSGLTGLLQLLTAHVYPMEYCGSAGGRPDAPVACVAFMGTIVMVHGTWVLVLAGIFAALLVGMGVAAVVHSRTDAREARVTLWVATGLLTTFTTLSILSIGGFFLPSVGLALVSCLASIRRAQVAHV